MTFSRDTRSTTCTAEPGELDENDEDVSDVLVTPGITLSIISARSLASQSMRPRIDSIAIPA
jgi:hypothetical protein